MLPQYAYDAVWMFAEALNKMNSSDRNELRTLRVYEQFHQLLNFTNFTGISGQIDWFNRYDYILNEQVRSNKDASKKFLF